MAFVPGLTLCRRYHDEVVAPLLARRLPRLRYAAGRLDGGLELLGLDTPRSTDHDWGPRTQLFVADPADVAPVRAVLDAELPTEFLGWPTRFAGGPDVRLGVVRADGDRHGVSVDELGGWLRGRLGCDPRGGMTAANWLAVPTQRLAELTGGAVFHDGLDAALTSARARLAWYPDDVWRYVLAAGWQRISQAQHLAGRCAEVGDELGSRVVIGGLARDLMRLGLLLHRRWPPYAKWLGTVFAALPAAAPVLDALRTALGPGGWPERQGGLVRALETVAAWTNEPAWRHRSTRPPDRSITGRSRSWTPAGSPPRCAPPSRIRRCGPARRSAPSTSTSTTSTSSPVRSGYAGSPRPSCRTDRHPAAAMVS